MRLYVRTKKQGSVSNAYRPPSSSKPDIGESLSAYLQADINITYLKKNVKQILEFVKNSKKIFI